LLGLQAVGGSSQAHGDEEQHDAQSKKECIHFVEVPTPRQEGVMGWMDSRKDGVKSL